jgi:hypothetical protein
MFKMFTEQDVPKSALDMAYSPADPNPVSKIIRACRWLLCAAMFASLALIIIHGVRDSDYRFPSGGWYCFIVFNAGNYALYLLERHRKKKGSEKQ